MKLSIQTFTLTLILLTWRIGWAPYNASKWEMGFNSAFKGLMCNKWTPRPMKYAKLRKVTSNKISMHSIGHIARQFSTSCGERATRRWQSQVRNNLRLCLQFAIRANIYIWSANIVMMRTETALTFRRLMSYIYGTPILDVSRSHTTTQHSR